MEDNNRPTCGLEHGFRRLQLRMRKIAEPAWVVTFFDHRRPERGQAAIPGRICVNICQRHGRVAVVKQSELSQTAPVGFFDTLNVVLKKVCAFDSLYNC